MPPSVVSALPVLAPPRVHVVSGSFGAGHDAAADEVALRLTATGWRVVRWDVVDLFPLQVGRVARAAYLRQIRSLPGSWGALLEAVRPGRPLHRVAASTLAALPARRLAEIDAAGVDLWISTHPFASLALGSLRATGRLHAPAMTYLTDASVHALWVHPGVDLHLAINPVAARQARALGGRVAVVEPLTPQGSRPLDPAARVAVRRELGLPDAPIALLTGGSLGIGALECAAADVLATGLAVPVVLCGTNGGLRERLRLRGIAALGWRDDVPRLMAAADVVVQNAGGFMSLQARAAGVPVVSYRCLPGHGEANAASMEEAGEASWARGTDDLVALLAAALRPHAVVPAASAPSFLDLLPVPRLAVPA